jgi:molybdate transport system substrate-binding protein
MSHRHKISFLSAIFLLPCPTLSAEPLTIAVASNFVPTAEELATRFIEDTGYEVRISPGSTGKLYAQILNGAPYDVFLSADSERPAMLEANGLGVRGTRGAYAIGSLVLWSIDAKYSSRECRSDLQHLGANHLAIANPQTAPYGAAAKEFLLEAELWESVKTQLVYGESISQTLQFVASGNASIGLIAKAQSVDPRLPVATCNWAVPAAMHGSLEQQAVVLQRAADNTVAMKFIEFLASTSAQEIIVRRGYTVPEDTLQ